MLHNILITGASGYLGGTILARWASANIAPYDKLFALVRSDTQAQAVKDLYGATPLTLSLHDAQSVKDAIVSAKITIVIFLIDSYRPDTQLAFIDGLSEVGKLTGLTTHLVHTTGAKMFSEHSGMPVDRPLSDADPNLYDLQKHSKAPAEEMQMAMETNTKIIDAGLEKNVRTYIMAPCIVYGRGEGFGNRISIQTVDVVVGARNAGQVYEFPEKGQTWPVCSLPDTVNFFLAMIKAMVTDSNPNHGKNGFYLAASGSVAWHEIYVAMAKALKKREAIPTDEVATFTNEALAKYAEAQGVDASSVRVKIAGRRCTFYAEQGKQFGWSPVHRPEHILRELDYEVELILNELSRGQKTGTR
ncbi:hypothetical protein NW768_002758 [Fusarium equiseti]|uniref:NAD-dependent epimerase/dehydratase domain-containing protein n=1 Tax=Fusarium equiseti TaxID=61235 RepID=A0ABQ8RJY5_FUSEQ|nr:hypothetical protein NW768_002758 [Fusarium equiseti]